MGSGFLSIAMKQGEGHNWKLISEECTKKGYHIEVPRRKGLGQELRIVDTDKDILFFRQLVDCGVKLIHFVGEDSGNVIVVTTEFEKSKKFQRVIVRTAQEDQRLIVTATSKSSILKQIANQCPFLANVLFSFLFPFLFPFVDPIVIPSMFLMIITASFIPYSFPFPFYFHSFFFLASFLLFPILLPD